MRVITGSARGKHLKELPIDSPDYLDSKSNDNLYNF